MCPPTFFFISNHAGGAAKRCGADSASVRGLDFLCGFFNEKGLLSGFVPAEGPFLLLCEPGVSGALLGLSDLGLCGGLLGSLGAVLDDGLYALHHILGTGDGVAGGVGEAVGTLEGLDEYCVALLEGLDACGPLAVLVGEGHEVQAQGLELLATEVVDDAEGHGLTVLGDDGVCCQTAVEGQVVGALVVLTHGDGGLEDVLGTVLLVAVVVGVVVGAHEGGYDEGLALREGGGIYRPLALAVLETVDVDGDGASVTTEVVDEGESYAGVVSVDGCVGCDAARKDSVVHNVMELNCLY